MTEHPTVRQGHAAGDPVADGPRGPRRRRRGRAGWWIIGILLLLVVGAGVVAVSYLSGLASTFDNDTQRFETTFPEAETRPSKAPAEEGKEEPLNILLLGADSGGGSGESEDLPGVPQSGRSDTMMWVHIPGDREAVYVMSIMRDLWVEIPGEGTHKLNAAYSFGGVPKTIQTLEGMFDTRIDHVAAVDMAGFEGLVDTLGGVDITVPESFRAGNGGKSFQAGPQHMDGDTALSFVRERYAFADGDYSRVRNQQLFLKAVAQKVMTPQTLTNPVRISDMVSGLSPYLTLDETLDAGELVSIGRTMTDVRADDLEMFTVPTDGVGRARGQSVVWPDEGAIAEIAGALSHDDMAMYISGR